MHKGVSRQHFHSTMTMHVPVFLNAATQVHDNDIAYFPPSLLPQNESPSNSGSEDRKKRGATSENRKLWPNGVVYYTFSSRFNGNYDCILHYNYACTLTNPRGLYSVVVGSIIY